MTWLSRLEDLGDHLVQPARRPGAEVFRKTGPRLSPGQRRCAPPFALSLSKGGTGQRRPVAGLFMLPSAGHEDADFTLLRRNGCEEGIFVYR